MSKEVLGHIDCPVCGTAQGVRITLDKNGHPFGYCEAECNQQIRIGGNDRRVAAFIKRYPWAAGKTPVTVTAPAPAPSKAAKPVTVTPAATVAAPAPAPKRKPVANPFDFLLNPKATA